jgi:hypothetical protein
MDGALPERPRRRDAGDGARLRLEAGGEDVEPQLGRSSQRAGSVSDRRINAVAGAWLSVLHWVVKRKFNHESTKKRKHEGETLRRSVHLPFCLFRVFVLSCFRDGIFYFSAFVVRTVIV